jgi:signal transduction histidine kinase/CheY-like chemotaxis protein
MSHDGERPVPTSAPPAGEPRASETSRDALSLVERLREFTAAFAQLDDIDALVHLIDDVIHRTVPVEYHGLYLIDPETGAFRLPFARGFSEEERVEAERTAMDRHPGWVLRHRRVLHVPDVHADGDQRTSSSKRSFVVRSRLWIPVMSREECVGAFGLASTAPHSFSEEHIAVLSFVANLAGLVYGNLTSTLALRRALERAKSADRAKTAFLANMSHELRTPMNGVLGAASLLATTHLDDDQRELVSIVKASSHAMVSLVDDLLEVSKIEAGRLELRTSTVDLDGWLDGVLEIVAPQVADRGLAFRVRYLPDAPRALQIDPQRARQVLLNLLSNALKFTERGEVRLEVGGDEQGCALIHVQDSGIGISEANRSKLFERFSQLDDSITRKFGGTGLGLAISRQLAVAMGGALDLSWSEPGQGSRFTLRLPSAPPLTAEAPVPQCVVLQVREAPCHDDLALALQRLGWQVVDDDPDAPLFTDDLTLADQPGRRVVTFGPAGSSAAIRPPLRLGALRRSVAPAPRAPLPTPETPARSHVVLVVDDHAINRGIARRLLEHLGHHVLEASSGAEAIQRVAEQPVDLILLDIHMPDEDGIQVTRRLRRGDAGPVGRAIPIVACTADLLPQTAAAASEAGMNDVIHKPFTAERLTNVLREAVDVGRRVLVVDDVRTSRHVLRWMLERHGLQVEEASTGREALAKLQEHAYRLVLMDEHLGDLDGTQVVEALRGTRLPWRHLPILTCSGSAPEASDLGPYDDRLPKPIDAQALADALRVWCPAARAGATP